MSDADEQPIRGEGLEVMKEYLRKLELALPNQDEMKRFEQACTEVAEMLHLMTDSDEESAAAYVGFLEAALNHARSSQMLIDTWNGANQNAARLSSLIQGDRPPN